MTNSLEIDPRKVSLSEKDIEDWLYENPEVISTHTFHVHEWIARQYKLPSGIPDLLGVDQHNHLVVVEVKNVEINKAAILQVCRYALDLQEIAANRLEYPAYYSSDDGNNGLPPFVRKVVVGPSIDGQTFYEAVACDVSPLTFETSLQLTVLPMRWTSDYLSNRTQAIEELARGAEWARYGEHISDHLKRMEPKWYGDKDES